MSEAALYGVVYVCLLVVLALFGMHIGVAMLLIAAIGAMITIGPALVLEFGNIAWGTLNEFVLVALPMFVMMGEILVRCGVAERMYRALAGWLDPVPGGLLHTNIVASAMFSATSGSSVATAATVGSVALPTFRERGYDERIVVGSIAAGGTLGILIPPSVNLVLYGVLTDTSIGRLFVAGILPGIALTVLFLLVIVILTYFSPPPDQRQGQRLSLGIRLRLLADLLPPAFIFLAVMGSLFTGLATPTEAAAVGVIAALFLAACYRRLTIGLLHEVFRATVSTTAIVMLILVAAFFLNFVLSLLGVPQAMAQWIEGLGISPLTTIWVLVLVYIILGMFLETLSMMVTTIPVIAPVVISLGLDPVWFGIFIVLMSELALITPPVGMNLFVVQSVRGPGRDINDVIVGTLPFVGAMLLLVAAVIHLPEAVLWLPDLLFNQT